MICGIVGLGLIGGSFAKAYHEHGWQVLACDQNRTVLDFASIFGCVNGELTHENAAECDVILVCICPQAAISVISDFAPYFGEKPIVIDCCGTKRVVCDAVFPLAQKYGFTYLGGHPMAGSHKNGFSNARSNLYHNAPMVLVPPVFDDLPLLEKVKELLAPAEFGRFSITTAQKHDEMIAFTSQLAHVVSNAYIKSPTALSHKGFSAGSYKDMTRVAWLDSKMWAELFMENKDCLLFELDTILHALEEYKHAIEQDDLPALTALLESGKKRKEEVDGR